MSTTHWRVRLRCSVKTQETGHQSLSAEVSHTPITNAGDTNEKLITSLYFKRKISFQFPLDELYRMDLFAKNKYIVGFLPLSSLHSWHKKRSYLLQRQKNLDWRPETEQGLAWRNCRLLLSGQRREVWLSCIQHLQRWNPPNPFMLWRFVCLLHYWHLTM